MPKAPEWLSADIQEFYSACQGNIKAIQWAILDRRGQEIAYMTVSDRMKRLGLERPRDQSKKVSRGTSMNIAFDPIPTGQVAVVPASPSIDDTDTPAEVHYGAVGEFDRLPDGYAKTIQPMRPYTEAEEAALNESMRLYGFIGAIVRDQYGRILDGTHRQRVARLRGLGVPYTITQVKDDAHAMDIARAANAVRRQYTREQREQIAIALRDQGFSYRMIAEALGVSHTQARADVREAAKVETNGSADPMPTDRKVESTFQSTTEPSGSPITDRKVESTFQSTEPDPTPPQTLPKRVTRKGGGTYPAQRLSRPEETALRMTQREGPNHSWINVLSHAQRLCSSLWRSAERDEVFVSWGPEGRQKAIEYLRPLYKTAGNLLERLDAIEASKRE
jgi:hypothetical protein